MLEKISSTGSWWMRSALLLHVGGDLVTLDDNGHEVGGIGWQWRSALGDTRWWWRSALGDGGFHLLGSSRVLGEIGLKGKNKWNGFGANVLRGYANCEPDMVLRQWVPQKVKIFELSEVGNKCQTCHLRKLGYFQW